MPGFPFPADAQHAHPHAETPGGDARGVEVPDAATALPEQRTAGAHTPARLVITRGPEAGRALDLAGERVLLGRHHDCDLVLEDTTVSDRHAEIRREADGRHRILDAGSLNGVFLNRRPVTSAELHDRDELWIGKVRFTFEEPR
ncbi:FHA domain-containing protein [Salinifilum ghardaiensis]